MRLLGGLQPAPDRCYYHFLPPGGAGHVSGVLDGHQPQSGGGAVGSDVPPRHSVPPVTKRGPVLPLSGSNRAVSEVYAVCPARDLGRAHQRVLPAAPGGAHGFTAGNCVAVTLRRGGPQGGGALWVGAGTRPPATAGTRCPRHGQPESSSPPTPSTSRRKTLATRRPHMHCTLVARAPIWSRFCITQALTISDPHHGPHGVVLEHLEPLLLTGESAMSTGANNPPGSARRQYTGGGQRRWPGVKPRQGPRITFSLALVLSLR
ncbi:hypothetical protein GWK47_028237 [Chionoecetes opilio]|uniref:Uncharacterized protein n=1 Tax=Chionoecetes opilio TaxID=41210 RepID=A0A8J4YPE0_CHIOP|nr:hypothetical protein GWK47_028237 [Chionoecetes opilio]